jgi:5-(carboxyamino)imidazole ribonucleotide synthase
MTTVGIIGAGQLGQMIGFAGKALDIEFLFLDPAENPPAATAGRVLRYPFDDEEGLAELVAATDILTYEFENVPVEAIRKLAPGKSVYPPAEALEKAQDRLREKELFESLNIPVPAYRPVDSIDDLDKAAADIGLPIVLKTRRWGYDGKGQRIVRSRDEIHDAVPELGGNRLIAEQWVPFDREVSIIGARNVSGDIVHYPLTENVHIRGILSTSIAPAANAGLGEMATDYMSRLLERLDYVGVLALELFVDGDRLLANEFAPRVHNSGHWTIEGAETSQFENHLRAILDMPLGSTALRGHAGMVNLIGTMPANVEPFDSGICRLHDYGKHARPGRKLGHATVVSDSVAGRDEALSELTRLLESG